LRWANSVAARPGSNIIAVSHTAELAESNSAAVQRSGDASG
jgi:hypothetical protein